MFWLFLSLKRSVHYQRMGDVVTLFLVLICHWFSHTYPYHFFSQRICLLSRDGGCCNTPLVLICHRFSHLIKWQYNKRPEVWWWGDNTMRNSDFFLYITGTDKRYYSQCQKLLIFPNLETKISQFTCKKIERWHRS